jgi:hypothetical protein
MSYAIDGQCHNAEPGTFNRECGRPAVWVGEYRNGFRCGFCADCRREGYDARGVVSWQPFNQTLEIFLKVNRSLKDDRGIVDEVAMRSLFDAYGVPLDARIRIWRAVTSAGHLAALAHALKTDEQRELFATWLEGTNPLYQQRQAMSILAYHASMGCSSSCQEPGR